MDESFPRVIGPGDDEAPDLLSTLSSGTARRVPVVLHEEPTNATELTERVDTLLQNVQYHLRKLDGAGLVKVVDTVYPEKGREMKVYVSTGGLLVVVAADEETRMGLVSMLSGLFGGVAVLALLSALVRWVAMRGVGVFDGGDSAAESADAGAISTVTTEATPAAAQVIPPGPAFFTGGLVILLAVAAIQFVRR